MAIMEKKDTSRTRRSFPDEFKSDAVAMVLDDCRKIVDVAEAIGVGDGTLGNWARLERIERGELAEDRNPNADEQAECTGHLDGTEHADLAVGEA